MARAISLHVGVNVGAGHPIPLVGCVNDAQAMFDLPQLSDFDRRGPFRDGEATVDFVKAQISQAAADLESGGIFVFTFAGHGSWVVDEEAIEPDLADEGLVLHDRMLIDDVLGRELWPLFKPNTRILMIADSCYNGTVLELVSTRRILRRNKPFTFSTDGGSVTNTDLDAVNSGRVRTLPEASRLAHVAANKRFYMGFRNQLSQGTQINASVILLAACLDGHTTRDGSPHGVFTQAFLDVLSEANPPQNYDDLIGRICTRLNNAGEDQTPILTPAGARSAALPAPRSTAPSRRPRAGTASGPDDRQRRPTGCRC